MLAFLYSSAKVGLNDLAFSTGWRMEDEGRNFIYVGLEVLFLGVDEACRKGAIDEQVF